MIVQAVVTGGFSLLLAAFMLDIDWVTTGWVTTKPSPA
jgi:hypothetical protein